jgi:tetratricopeptide (TPR) repeat protein
VAISNKIVDAYKDVRAYVFRARTLAAVGMLDEAEADYEKVTQLAPDNTASWVMLFDFQSARGKLDEAKKAIDKAIELSPTNPAAVTRAVRLYSRSSDPEVRKAADTLMAGTLEANAEDSALALFEAQRQLSKATTESIERAQRLLGALTRSRPDLVQAWVLTAQAALAQGQADSSLEAISKGLATEPNDSQRRALLMLKAEAEKLRWPALAVATLRGLWERDQSDTSVGLALASAYKDTGDPQKALAVIEQMIASAQAGQAALLELAAADVVAAAGETDKAMERARKAAGEPGNEARAMLVMIRILANAGRTDEVFAIVRDWQKAHPQDVASIVMCAETLMSAADAIAGGTPDVEQLKARIQDAAITVLGSAAATYPDDYRVKLALATACQARGQADKAEELYRLVLTKAPDSPVAINNLAWLLAEAGGSKLKEAAALADRGRAKFPEFAELIDTRGVIYQRMNELGDAERELREAVRLSSVNSRGLATAKFHLAEVLAARDKKDEAVGLLNDVLGPSRQPAGLAEEDMIRAEELLGQLTQGAGGAAPGAR